MDKDVNTMFLIYLIQKKTYLFCIIPMEHLCPIQNISFRNHAISKTKVYQTGGGFLLVSPERELRGLGENSCFGCLAGCLYAFSPFPHEYSHT